MEKLKANRLLPFRFGSTRLGARSQGKPKRPKEKFITRLKVNLFEIPSTIA